VICHEIVGGGGPFSTLRLPLALSRYRLLLRDVSVSIEFRRSLPWLAG
jgi:hypothetical protein